MIKINHKFINPLVEKSLASNRQRINYNFHQHHENVNRFLNALQPNTYCQPHKHQNPDRFEVFLIFTGKVAVIEFNDDGTIRDTFVLDPAIGNFGVEIAPCVWHTIVCLDDDTVCYEIKEGPYNSDAAKYFADFAPAENDPIALDYLENLKTKLLSNQLLDK